MRIASPNDSSNNSVGIRPVDQVVLDSLRKQPGLTVTDLIDLLEVTATAVRQRLDRLEEMGLIERRKQTASRGRPTFKYFLSHAGWREVGATYADLAMAMWRELSDYPDQNVKRSVLDRVTKRMGKAYHSEITGSTLVERMDAAAKLLLERKIPAKVGIEDGMPVLEVQACPYPGLVSMEHDRAVCELERQVLSEALGQPIELCSCRLDGHQTCQFKPEELPSSASEK